ncbi:hypothetical protein KCMC57_up19090 [Kitasatospora sp. CMC57]|uniref:Uncharacterized protein n=1 Tax=Kitasatospora sp. CMC57 TaxID=3231513 RepID=A0AB33JVQ8_9ACTN
MDQTSTDRTLAPNQVVGVDYGRLSRALSWPSRRLHPAVKGRTAMPPEFSPPAEPAPASVDQRRPELRHTGEVSATVLEV